MQFTVEPAQSHFKSLTWLLVCWLPLSTSGNHQTFSHDDKTYKHMKGHLLPTAPENAGSTSPPRSFEVISGNCQRLRNWWGFLCLLRLGDLLIKMYTFCCLQ